MDNSFKPKLPPKPQAKPAQPAASYNAPREEGNTAGVNHLAMLGGLGLLAEIAEAGEQITDVGAGTALTGLAGTVATLALDPRDQIDPRKKFVPR